MQVNRDILTSIAAEGIKPAAQLKTGAFNRSLDQKINKTVSVNVLNKPTGSGENWLADAIDALLTDRSRGIIQVGIERQSSERELNQFFNEESGKLASEVAKRVEHTVLLSWTRRKCPFPTRISITFLEEQPFVKGEVILDTPVPPEAITHAFIPEGLREVAAGIFKSGQLYRPDANGSQIERPSRREYKRGFASK